MIGKLFITSFSSLHSKDVLSAGSPLPRMWTEILCRRGAVELRRFCGGENIWDQITLQNKLFVDRKCYDSGICFINQNFIDLDSPDELRSQISEQIAYNINNIQTSGPKRLILQPLVLHSFSIKIRAFLLIGWCSNLFFVDFVLKYFWWVAPSMYIVSTRNY